MSESRGKFALSFSGGKDSFLALKKMMDMGYDPACLMVGVLPQGLSHMHGMRQELFERYSESLEIPVVYCSASKKYDRLSWIKAAKTAREEYGAKFLCTGDIAFEMARDFNRDIADELGMMGIYPLFGMDEKALVSGLLDSGFKIMIKSLATSLGLDELVGRELNEEAIELLAKKGLYLSADTDELHTVVVDGGFFKKPIEYRFGETRHIKQYTVVDMIPL